MLHTSCKKKCLTQFLLVWLCLFCLVESSSGGQHFSAFEESYRMKVMSRSTVNPILLSF